MRKFKKNCGDLRMDQMVFYKVVLLAVVCVITCSTVIASSSKEIKTGNEDKLCGTVWKTHVIAQETSKDNSTKIKLKILTGTW